MKQFKVVKCPKCGSVQVTQSLVRLKCKFCEKSSAIKGKKLGWNVDILTSFPSGAQAAWFVAEYNRRQHV